MLRECRGVPGGDPGAASATLEPPREPGPGTVRARRFLLGLYLVGFLVSVGRGGRRGVSGPGAASPPPAPQICKPCAAGTLPPSPSCRQPHPLAGPVASARPPCPPERRSRRWARAADLPARGGGCTAPHQSQRRTSRDFLVDRLWTVHVGLYPQCLQTAGHRFPFWFIMGARARARVCACACPASY